ncbi:MAG TPA: hypothetical protein VFN79_18200 [Steroidobacteraceae bacterium]|nr:hypothetical protein [Steroidobacteraceae bacterium]
MTAIRYIARGSCLLSLAALLAGCVLAPPGDYSDRPHDRYYHDRSWHDCHGRRYGDDRDDRDNRDGGCRR